MDQYDSFSYVYSEGKALSVMGTISKAGDVRDKNIELKSDVYCIHRFKEWSVYI